ncbi:MAG: hypothetical protein D6706_09010 [Chloroflexi bacterium]|nr:MAG: hypothetical protein D6706_09010 [Chloroflexota bacterium]
MSEMQTNINSDWKKKVLIAGTLIGAFVGFGTAYLMARTAEESSGGPPKITTKDALKIGVNVIGVVRGIAALADR